METPAEPQASYDEALKKIGRNLLLFQQAEDLVKRLVALDSATIHSGHATDDLDTRASRIDTASLGHAAKRFLGRIHGGDSPSPDSGSDWMNAAPDSMTGQSSIHLRIRIGGDMEERTKSFNELIHLRNEFVHHLISKINPESAESCMAIATEMDDLRRQILPEIQHLQQDLRSTRSAVEAVLDFLETPTGMEELMLPEIQHSPLIRNLAEIAAAQSTPDGWMPVGEAVQQLQDFPQEAIKDHLDQFGKKSLTSLMAASRLFDTVLAPNESGGKRALFRLKQSNPSFPFHRFH